MLCTLQYGFKIIPGEMFDDAQHCQSDELSPLTLVYQEPLDISHCCVLPLIRDIT